MSKSERKVDCDHSFTIISNRKPIYFRSTRSILELSVRFLKDIDFFPVRDNELSKYTKAKGYQTKEQFDALSEGHNRYQSKLQG